MTSAEMVLWEKLSGSQLGAKFRRQHPIGLYIADFYCHKYRLIVEVDGSIHNQPEIAEHDKTRQTHLELRVSQLFASPTNRFTKTLNRS
jgi:cyclase